MQRGKKKLHVDTFPFLAVLLCAMGSLILLLMVMDRRAKAVARHKLAQEMEARQEQRKGTRDGKLKDALANRQADWEKERDQLHATLAAQEEELRSQLAGMVHEVKGAEQKVEAKQTEYIFLQQKLAQEYERLLKDREKLSASLTHLSVEDKKAAQAGEQMRRATMELLQLEQALRELKELRSRPSNAYSLVPFSGKRGDSRKPVYVECYAEGIVMHPNRTLMHRDDLTVEQFRDEIQKRAGQLEREKEWDRRTLTPPPTNAHAYVLFLVRPDGIDTYWTAQTALRGYAIDYGYEFVDASWTFDFSNEDAVAGQPWNNYGAGSGKVRPMLVSNRPGWPAKGRPGFGAAGLEGPPGSGTNGNGGPGSGDSGFPGPGGSGPGSGGMSGPGSQGTPFNSLAPGNGYPGNGPKGPPGMKYGSGSGTPASGSGSLAGLSGSGYGSGPLASGTGPAGNGLFGPPGSKPGAYTNGLSGPPGSGTGTGGNGLGGPPGSGTGVAGSGWYGPPGSQVGSPVSGLPGPPGFGPPGSGPGASGIGLNGPPGSLTSGLSGPPGSGRGTPGSAVGGSGTGTLGNGQVGQAGTGPGTPGNGPPGSGTGSAGNGQSGNAGTGLAMLGAPTFGMPNGQGGSTFGQSAKMSFGDPTNEAGGPGSGGDGGPGIGNGNGTGSGPGNGPAGLGSGNGGQAGSSGTGIPQVGSRPNTAGAGMPPTVIAGDPGLPKFDGSTAKAGSVGGNQYGLPNQAGGVPGQGDPNATGGTNGPGSASPRPAYSIWSPGTVSAMGASGNAGPSSPPGILQSALFPQNPGSPTGQQQGAGNGPPGNSFAVPSVGGNGNVANAGNGTGQNNPLRPPGQNAGNASSESAYGNFGASGGSGSDGSGGVPSGGGSSDGQPSSPLNIGTGGAAPSAGGGGPSKTAPGTALPENVAQGPPSFGGGAPSTGPAPRAGNRPVPPPPGRLMGNHDYVITLECRPDGVVIYPRFYLYPLNPASNQKNVEQALVRDVQQLITRRQASVRPGETPFRPMIRLQVAPDGVRAYYWIYPALQQLNVPMFRENAEN